MDKDFLDAVYKYIDGQITDDELLIIFKGMYDDPNEIINRMVHARIYKNVLQESFALSVDNLCATHRYLFNGINEKAGIIRDINLTRKEPCIDYESVIYSPSYAIMGNLTYDISNERSKNLSSLSDEQIVKKIIPFLSCIWQCHPFSNGNTRTCAIYIQKYLRTYNIILSNTSFKNNALYFRNALVRSNYSTNKDIVPTNEYLEHFFDVILNFNDALLDVSETYIDKGKSRILIP